MRAGTITPASLQRLQQSAGNRAVGELVAPAVQRDGPTPAAQDTTAHAEPFQLDGFEIGTYAEAATATRLWVVLLEEDGHQLTREGLGLPPEAAAAVTSGRDNVSLWAGGGTERFDRGNAEDLRAWHARYIRARNAIQADMATEAARRARAAADRLEEARASAERAEPALRDKQRAAFRAQDDSRLLQITDTIATVLDTALVARAAIDQTLDVAGDLRAWAGTARNGGTIAVASQRVTTVLAALEQVNRAYAAFQLMRSGLELVAGGGRTGTAQGHAAVSAMSTLTSAGGTLLGASAGFTLYSNIYIGPMVEACLSALSRLEETISRTQNRFFIQMGELNSVNWDLEPGGRPVFTYLSSVMHAGSAGEVQAPPSGVASYLISNESSVNAGAAGGDDVPTTGHWFWRDVDASRIAPWVFAHRRDLWGMFYGDCQVP